MRHRPPWRLRDLPTARLLGAEVPVARRLRTRLLGLALLRRDRAGPGLLLPRCSSVHTFGMRFAIDVVFLDRAGAVLRVAPELRPNRIVACRGAAAVLELPGARSAPGAGLPGGENKRARA